MILVGDINGAVITLVLFERRGTDLRFVREAAFPSRR